MLAFMPIPTTTHPGVGAASVSTPTTFLPSTSTSFGHFSRARSPVVFRTATAAAIAAANPTIGTLSNGRFGLRITESHTPPRGDAQPSQAAPARGLLVRHHDGAFRDRDLRQAQSK